MRRKCAITRLLHFGTSVAFAKVACQAHSGVTLWHCCVLPCKGVVQNCIVNFISTYFCIAQLILKHGTYSLPICGCHLECCFMLSLPLHNFIFSAVSNQHMHLSLAFKHVTCFYLLSIVAVVRGILMCGWRQVFLKLNRLCHHVQCYSVSRGDLLVKAASGRAGTCVW